MISAFKALRLSNTLVSGVSGRLMVGGEYDAHLSDLTSASGSLASSIALTGSNLYNLIQAASAGVSSVNSASGSITLVGAGDVSVTTVGQTITISGNTGQLINYATNINLASTGQQNYLSIIGGDTNLSGNLALTGQAAWTAANNNGINLSGNLLLTGQNLYNYIHTFSGNSQSFATGINPTGFDTYAVGFPLGQFSSTPRVYCTVEISGNIMYGVNITGRNPNGFWALFSDIISESGVVLNTFATINS